MRICLYNVVPLFILAISYTVLSFQSRKSVRMLNVSPFQFRFTYNLRICLHDVTNIRMLDLLHLSCPSVPCAVFQLCSLFIFISTVHLSLSLSLSLSDCFSACGKRYLKSQKFAEFFGCVDCTYLTNLLTHQPV